MLLRCLFVLFLLMPFKLFAWQSMPVKGRIVNQESGVAIGGASVYINNSTFGTVCNSEGFFLLEHHPALPFELIISAIGYETEVMKITAINADQPLNVSLKTKLLDIAEVTITSPEKNGWEKYGKTFTEEFIGYSDFAKQCKLLNKEVLQFNFNPKTGILKVWADAPLQIRNNATGYNITYWLDDFELNQFKHLLYFRGYAHFSALKTSNARQKIKRFEENRKLAYEGSVYHFMRSLYKGNPLEEGFEIRKLMRMAEDDAGAYLPKKTDTIFRKDTGKVKALAMEISDGSASAINFLMNLKNWWDDSTKVDPLKIVAKDTTDTLVFKSYVFIKDTAHHEKIFVNYYESRGEQQNANAEKPPILMTKRIFLNENIKIDKLPTMKTQPLDFLFLPLLKTDSLVWKEESGKVNLRFTNYLHVTYTKEKEESEYLNKKHFFKKIMPADQQSIISITNKDGISITEDGNFYNSYDMMAEQYWSYEKLDKLLPLDYIKP